MTIQPSADGEFKIVYVAFGGTVDYTNNWGSGYWIPGSGSLNTEWSVASGGGNAAWKGDNISQLDSYVHFVIKDPENSIGSNLAIGIMTLSAAPVTLSSTTNTSTATLGDTQTISTTLSATPSAEEYFYVRYTDDNWSTSTIEEMTVSTTTASYDLQYIATGTYQYYVFSSTVDLTGITAASDVDILTINYDNNSGSNFLVTVGSIDPATSFSATADAVVGYEEIDLTWALNGSSNEVIVVASTVQSPDDLTQGLTYSVNDGDIGTAAGKVIYRGSATSFDHGSLTAETTYYYKIFSANGNDYYSAAATASETTDAAPATLTASVTTAMDEDNLDGSVIDLALLGETFTDATLDAGNFELQNVPSGTTIASVSYTSTTEASVTLAFDGTDFDTDRTAANVRILAAELTGSVNLTSNNLTISATADAEEISADWGTTPGSNGVEATLDDEVVRVSLTGGQFISGQINTTSITATGTATSSGVGIESVSYVDDATVDVTLSWDGTDYDTDQTLTINIAGDAYNEGTATLTADITLTATDEPIYTATTSDPAASFLDELTIVFEDEKPVDDFYTDGQDYIFMEIALRIDGSDWNYQRYLSRDGGGSILSDGSNDDIKLDKQLDGSYQITIDPVSFFGPVSDGTTVDGFNIILFNQYHTDVNATNNVTSTLFIDLVDEEYNKTSISPAMPVADESVTLTFDARGTALEDASQVYFHSGVATDEPGSTSFDIAVGNWGADDGVGEMTLKSGTTNIWEITLTSITDYYSLPAQDNAFSLNYLFRSADGSVKEDNGGSNYTKELDPGNYFLIDSPTLDLFLVQTSTSFNISATANASVDWVLEEVGDPNTEVEIQSAQTTFSFDHSITSTSELEFQISADFGTETRIKTFRVQGYSAINDVTLPAGATAGINYDESDDTEVTLVLHTPTSTDYKKGDGTVSGTGSTAAKEVVHVIGDFNNWEVSESYKMNRDGDYWWLTITGLTAGEDYVFQYLIDGDIRIGDPYAEQVSDSDDQYISASVYPGLPTYPSDKTSGRASVINTSRTEYTWEVTSFTPKASNELNIYELHFRDFTEEGTYLAAIDKLDYLQELGITAIHVMPVSEFEGNSSWGYNPNYYLAADKAYGKPNDLKKFIDEAHKRDMAVFNDIVFNHAFGSNPMVLMYWDDANNRPATDNPWFNAEHKAVYNSAGHWGNDWNHESEHTQAFVDRTLDYWLTEFKFDGFRFDFTKGFTQTAPDAGDEWASTPDTDRQGLLKRMVDAMWVNKPGSIAIFEHLADAAEDKVLADYGILMWSGVGHHNQIKNLNLGYTTDDVDIYTTGVYNSSKWGFTYANLISYGESHDEERQAYEMFTYGNVVKDIAVEGDRIAEGVERLKGGLAFNLMFPGPRMLWQFQELAYDYSIDYNGRTGEKPVKWDYFDNTDRKELYILASQLLHSRNTHDWYSNSIDYSNLGSGSDYTVKKLKLSDGEGNYMIILSNPDADDLQSTTPGYAETGTWYENNGDVNLRNESFTVSSTNETYSLDAGRMVVLTNFELPIPSLADSDEDGVLDIRDDCADTPLGANVDEFGCIIKDSQTITFGAISAQNLFDGPLTLTATASSGLDVSYASSDENIATISGSVVTFLQAGTVTITASQDGSIFYESAASVDQDLQIIEQYIWDGAAWNSGSTPPADKDVQFDGNYTLTSDMETASVYVSTSVTLTIDPGASLTDNNEVYNDGTIVVKSGGQLITLGSVYGTDYRIERITTFDENTGRYSIVGTPVEDAGFSVLGASALIYGYDESEPYNPTGNEGLDRFKTPAELSQTMMQPGQGYFSAFTGDMDGKVVFIGTPNSGTIDFSLSYTDQGTTEEEAYEGFNLIANPYPAAIEVDAFLTANSSAIDQTVYLWDDNGSNTGRGDNGDYLFYNKTLGTTNTPPAGGASKWDGFIRSGQGFFVKTSAAGTGSFTDGMKGAAHANDDGGFYRLEPVLRYKLVLSDNTQSKATILGYIGDATTAHDGAYDAIAMNGSGMSVYTREPGSNRKLAIQGLPSGLQDEILLGFQVSESGMYTLSLANLEEVITGCYILDTYTQKKIDLTKGEYSFASQAGVFEERFRILTPETITGLSGLQEISMFGKDGYLHLLSDQLIKAGSEYQLSDLMGKTVVKGRFDSNSEKQVITVEGVSRSVYILSLSQEGRLWSGKVIIE